MSGVTTTRGIPTVLNYLCPPKPKWSPIYRTFIQLSMIRWYYCVICLYAVTTERKTWGLDQPAVSWAWGIRLRRFHWSYQVKPQKYVQTSTQALNLTLWTRGSSNQMKSKTGQLRTQCISQKRWWKLPSNGLLQPPAAAAAAAAGGGGGVVVVVVVVAWQIRQICPALPILIEHPTPKYPQSELSLPSLALKQIDGNCSVSVRLSLHLSSGRPRPKCEATAALHPEHCWSAKRHARPAMGN